MNKWVLLIVVLWLSVSSQPVQCQPVQVNDDVSRNVHNARSIAPLDNDLFGEQVSGYTGITQFHVVDLSIPGNNSLEVAVSRTFDVHDRARTTGYYGGLMGEWDLDIPHLSGIFKTSVTPGVSGWQVSTSGNPNQRCSVDRTNFMTATPPVAIGTNAPLGAFSSAEYWYGNELHVPGKGSERMMVLAPSNPNRPADGSEYYWATNGQWMFSCLPQTANGIAGEAFLAVSPDGTKYKFDWFASRGASQLEKVVMQCTIPNPACNSILGRSEVWIMPTLITDKFGNTVTYAYDPANPRRLLSIQASDGRRIDLSYNSSGRVASIASNGRSWSYAYTPLGSLTEVTQPDGAKWLLDSSSLAQVMTGYSLHSDCVDPPSYSTGGTNTATFTHPSGAVGTFTFTRIRHSRSYVPRMCLYGHGGSSYQGISPVIDTVSITAKQISGPGLVPSNWTFSYSNPLWTYVPNCPNDSCSSTKTTTITNPDGSWKKTTYSNRYNSAEGRALVEETGTGTTVLKRVLSTYQLSSSGQPYPAKVGNLPCYYCDDDGEGLLPIKTQTVQQDGVDFTTNTTLFDAFGGARGVEKFSSLGYYKSETWERLYHLPKWTLGLVRSVACTAPSTCAGIVSVENTYDAATAAQTSYRSFGRLVQSFARASDGTLSTLTDGNNNVTTFGGWKRGIPQSIKYPITPESPTGAVQSAVVDNNGWITSVTDENVYKTCYRYDSMGRVDLITYPSETTTGVCDASAWTPTTIAFTGGNTAAYGVPAGHWRQTTLTGNGRKILVFDALWRPVVEQTLDLSNVSGTLSEVIKRYDAEGQVIFQSYPMNTNGQANYADPTLKGIFSEYDALGRLASVSQDSELGLLTTTTEYLAGFKTRVTPPKGQPGSAAQQTTTSYLAYEQPTYDWPVAIVHPEGALTDITRDAFGKPTVLKRRNSASSLAITRGYAYNSKQELCRIVEPETGAILTGYDAAGNLKWSAAGLPTATACEANGTSTAVAARRADRTFDARNRVKSLSFPNGLGNTTYAYTPDGLASSVVTNNGATDGQATINYAYNKRRLITRETLITPQLNWPYDYGYNANGHLAVNNWHGLNIDYAPNALGQPTKAGTYASGVSYYPNGAIKQFTYGNGIVHTMTQNARQLPSRSTDSVTGSTPLDLGYAYDKHANVSGVTDYLTGARQTRGMTYDNLDRLTQTTSSMFGTATYGYNVLDNLTTVNVAGGNKARSHAYVYDANNRLANVTTGVGGPTVIGLGYDVQGNLANKSGVLYSFDYGNRLRTVTDPVAAKTSTYAYDGLGRRVKDVVNGLSKHSQYTQSGQLVMVGDERATDVSEYVYLGGSLLAIRERDVPTAAYTTKYLHTDALGTPIAMTSQSRTLLETSEYEPFGQQVNRVGAAKDGPGYTGHVQDGATGLTYMQQRYYDPMIGRFLSTDPVTANTGAGENFNRYWYANNNPYLFADPDGRNPNEEDEDSTSLPGRGKDSSVKWKVPGGGVTRRAKSNAARGNGNTNGNYSGHILSIRSNVTSNQDLTAGHAWLVDTYEGSEQTWGLWPDGHPKVVDNGDGTDVRSNMEAGQQAVSSRSYRLTNAQYRQFQRYLLVPDTWSYGHTCADWARDGMQAATGINLDVDDYLGIETPRELSETLGK